MNRMQRWVLAGTLAVAAIAVCYVFVDRPLALLVHERLLPFRDAFILLTLVPEPFPVMAALILFALGARSLSGLPLSRPLAVALLWSASLLVTTVINRQLKFAFGRVWPETWVNNNPSFIRDGVYGFHPFHGGQGFAAFPSGHMAAICVAATVLWIAYPRVRVVYALIVAIVTIGLMGANFHFLSDVIAGGFVGFTVGLFAVALWEAGGYRRLWPETARPQKPARKKTRAA
jgi:membrane-associated phospholipid phosphatase